MKRLCILFSVVSILQLAGCESKNSQTLRESTYNHEAQAIVSQVANDSRCSTLAEGAFGRPVTLANANDQNAVLVEFKWSSSQEAAKEQKVSCYFVGIPGQ